MHTCVEVRAHSMAAWNPAVVNNAMHTSWSTCSIFKEQGCQTCTRAADCQRCPEDRPHTGWQVQDVPQRVTHLHTCTLFVIQCGCRRQSCCETLCLGRAQAVSCLGSAQAVSCLGRAQAVRGVQLQTVLKDKVTKTHLTPEERLMTVIAQSHCTCTKGVAISSKWHALGTTGI